MGILASTGRVFCDKNQKAERLRDNTVESAIRVTRKTRMMGKDRYFKMHAF